MTQRARRWGLGQRALLVAGAVVLGTCATAGAETPRDEQPAATRPVDGGMPPGLVDRDGDRLSDDLEARLAMTEPSEQVDVVVTFRASGSAASAQRDVGPFVVRQQFRSIRGFSARMTADQVARLAARPNVFRIEGEAVVRATNETNNRDFGTAAARQDFGVDGAGVGVCIVDTGVDPSHEQLDGGKVVGFFDAINGRTDPYDDQGHGTHVAATAVGDGTGPSTLAASHRGVAPAASLYSAKALNSSGSGTTTQIINAIEWCTGRGDAVDVISMSLGTATGSDGLDALSQAVNTAAAAGDIVVVAAGNSGEAPSTVGSPGAAAGAVTVGAVSDWSAPPGSAAYSEGIYLAPFSSRGPTLASPGNPARTKPDVAAPGMSVVSAKFKTVTEYTAASGTSMATPFTAGTVALAVQRAGSLTTPQVKALLATSAVDFGPPGQDNDWGNGVLDGYAFVAQAAGRSGATAFPGHARVSGSVPDGGMWIHQVVVTEADVAAGVPLAATVLVDGELICTLPFGQVCFLEEWSPDLEARLRGPDGAELDLSTCAAGDECGNPPVGRQETLHARPAVAGTYTIEIFPSAGEPNNGKGGSFLIDISSGVPGAPPPPPPPPPSPPAAVDDTSSTNEDTAVVIAVLANDTDATGVSGVTAAANGTVSTNGTTVTYVPNTNFSGVDSFTYTASGPGGTDTAAVTVSVVAVNDPPVAVDDGATTPPGTPVTIAVLANDSDVDSSSLTVAAVTAAAHGTVATDGATVTYTPAAGFTGTDTFGYTASDGAASDTATVSVTVSGETTIAPATATVTTGSFKSGTAASLAADDSNIYAVNSTKSGVRTTAWTGGFGGVPASVSAFTVTYRGSNTRSCSQSLWILNRATATWEQLGPAVAVGTTEVTIQRSLTDSLSAYRSAAGAVDVQVQCTNNSRTFTTRADLLSLTYS